MSDVMYTDKCFAKLMLMSKRQITSCQLKKLA